MFCLRNKMFPGYLGIASNVNCRVINMTLRKMAYLQSSVLPRINVPQKMMTKIENNKKKQVILKAEKKRKTLRFKSPLLISCKRSEFNHHKGQTYSDFNPKMLASHGWKHRKSAGDHFTLTAYDANPALIPKDDHTDSWFGLGSQLLHGLSDMNITSPTNIQKLTIPKLLQGHNVICAAETGSGKTLAYLLPLLELIQKQQQSGLSVAVNSPKAIILVPSRELADQIMGVAEKLSEHLPFVPYSVCGGRRTKLKLFHPEKTHMDLLISTPGILRKLLSFGLISSSHLQHVVLDEADTLLDDSFNKEIQNILRKLGVQGGKPTGDKAFVTTGMQVALVSATLPRALDTTIGDIIPVDIFTRITTNSLHHLMPHVQQNFLRLLPSMKPEEIIMLSKKSVRTRTATMIFCNNSKTCNWLGYLLDDNELENIVMNGQMSEKVRSGRFEQFQSGKCDIMVCTDIGSRGLDTVRVKQIFNYNFPHFISDYIHRAGRVGRVGSSDSCTVTSFISHKWDVDLLWQIEISCRNKKELHNVNANIKRKLLSKLDDPVS